ncbi:MAG: sigma-54-dependent Fis family transcriptional regulator, partial [Lentisphaerae bacterium]
RIICATNRGLQEMVEQGTFRADLYHRLSLAVLHIPPLRERREDIPLLARKFLDDAVQRHKLPPLELTQAAIARLMEYSWPGNVRELLNTIERSALLATSSQLDADDIHFLNLTQPSPPQASSQASPSSPDRAGQNTPPVITHENFPLPDDQLPLEEHINQLAIRVMKKFNNNKSHAARYLGLSWAALQRRLQKAGYEPES